MFGEKNNHEQLN